MQYMPEADAPRGLPGKRPTPNSPKFNCTRPQARKAKRDTRLRTQLPPSVRLDSPDMKPVDKQKPLRKSESGASGPPVALEPHLKTPRRRGLVVCSRSL